jgi:DNA mismatch endonuclease, patch repair protein
LLGYNGSVTSSATPDERHDRPSERTVTLGGGLTVPYPEPTSESASRIGRANRRQDTRCEVLLRSELHRRGLRFRKDLLVRAGTVRVHVDVAFTRVRLAVFVDGCFWHCCPTHFHMPKSNLSYWVPKLEANVERDHRVDAALRESGWTPLRLWEHLAPGEGADMVVASLNALS